MLELRSVYLSSGVDIHVSLYGGGGEGIINAINYFLENLFLLKRTL